MAKKLNHHLFKRGDTHYFQASVNGHSDKKSLGRDIGQARVLRDQLLNEIHWGHLDIKSDRLVVGEVGKRWIKTQELKLHSFAALMLSSGESVGWVQSMMGARELEDDSGTLFSIHPQFDP